MKRGAVDLHTESKKEKEKTDKKEKVVYRYRESSFEKGEQVAVLGIVQRVTDDKGAPVDVVKTVFSFILFFPFSDLKHVNYR